MISFLDTAHNAKNASLQQMSMARVLMLGRWPVLAAHLVDVQAADPSAGLYACDTAGSGPGWSPPYPCHPRALSSETPESRATRGNPASPRASVVLSKYGLLTRQ